MSLDPNKLFQFSNYDCIGFDLDNTLARYKIGNLSKTIYKALANSLIRKGYSAKYLDKSIEDDVDFIMRGLISDSEKGNLLKVDSEGRILIGTHGTKKMSRTELIATYGEKMTWGPIQSFVEDPLSTWNGPVSEQKKTALDFYQTTASLVFARAVDGLDEKYQEGAPEKYKQIHKDIQEAFNIMFAPEAFSEGTGGLHEHLKKNPKQYYYECSENLISWLKNLRKENELNKKKVLFLITGSRVDYASFTADKTLGPNWRDLFDMTIYFAKKPGFFTEGRPFIGVERLKEVSRVENGDLKAGHCYSHGNWEGLREFLVKSTGKENPKIVYLGDNFIQDVYAPAKMVKWDTVFICEELQAEGICKDENVHPEEKYLTSRLWGSYFHHKGEDAIWKDLMIKHANLCVPSLEYVAKYPVDHKFSTNPLI